MSKRRLAAVVFAVLVAIAALGPAASRDAFLLLVVGVEPNGLTPAMNHAIRSHGIKSSSSTSTP